jgi:hypothetical protein
MELKVIRKEFTDSSTIGEMWIDNTFFCYTLEDVKREVKIYGETCIPYGRYKVIVNMSNRFKVMMPLLLDVPQFEGIRIHKGNKAIDTHGCILVGLDKTKDAISLSKIAYEKLMKKLEGQNNIYITIV